MGATLRDNLRMAAEARKAADLEIRAKMDTMDRSLGPKVAPIKAPLDNPENKDSNGVSTGPSKGLSTGQTKGQTGQTFGLSTGQTKGQSSGHTIGQSNSVSNSVSGCVDTESAMERFRPVAGPRTKSEAAVWKFLLEHTRIIISLRDLSEEVRIPEATVRKVLRRFESQGFLNKAKAAGNDGMMLVFTPNGQTRGQSNGLSSGQSTSHSKIDREKNLSISQERVDLTWPHLAATGFGAHQIEQISQALAELGKPADRIVQSLDHAEWELEHGRMLDKDGQPVTDPCSWVFRSLSRTGYYRRPKGYVSPEEQAAKDAEAETKAVVAARQAAEQAQFEAWRDGLSPDELTDALRGHPGGPKDAWLKKIWRDRRN